MNQLKALLYPKLFQPSCAPTMLLVFSPPTWDRSRYLWLLWCAERSKFHHPGSREQLGLGHKGSSAWRGWVDPYASLLWMKWIGFDILWYYVKLQCFFCSSEVSRVQTLDLSRKLWCSLEPYMHMFIISFISISLSISYIYIYIYSHRYIYMYIYIYYTYMSSCLSSWMFEKSYGSFDSKSPSHLVWVPIQS